MSIIVKYSDASTYTLIPTKVDEERVQDIVSYHIPATHLNEAVRLGLGFTKMVLSGDILSKTACLWHDIVAISLDSGTTYQTAYFPSVSFSDDTWSGIYRFTLSLLVSPLKEGTAVRWPSSGYQWGQSSLASVKHNGLAGLSAICELNYLAPSYYFPLLSSLSDFAGRGLTFTRTLAKIHGGISYLANVPIYDNGLLISSETSQDTASLTFQNLTAHSIYARLKQTRYPSNWVVGAGAGTANLLTANQSNAETDTTGIAASGGTLTRDTAAPLAGAGSLKLVATGGANAALNTGGTKAAVTAGQWYCAQALVKTTGCAAGRTVNFNIVWYTSGGTYISEEGLNAAIAAPTSATVVSCVCKAPATAALAMIQVWIVSAAANETLYVDSLMLEALPTAVTVWDDGSKNKVTIDFVANTITWGDYTSTVAATFPTSDYLRDKDTLEMVCIHNGNTKEIHCRILGGTWNDATGTLAALLWTNAITLGNLEGSISHLIQYPYVLTSAEYSDVDVSSGPLAFNSMYISNQNAVTIQHTTDHRLLLPDGTDVSGLLGGLPLTVTTVATAVACIAGLSARWYLQVKDTSL